MILASAKDNHSNSMRSNDGLADHARDQAKADEIERDRIRPTKLIDFNLQGQSISPAGGPRIRW